MCIRVQAGYIYRFMSKRTTAVNAVETAIKMFKKFIKPNFQTHQILAVNVKIIDIHVYRARI